MVRGTYHVNLFQDLTMTVLIIFTIASIIVGLFGGWLLLNPHKFVVFNALFIKKVYVDTFGIPLEQLDKNLKIKTFIQAENKAGLAYFIEQAPHNPHQFKRAIGLFRMFGLIFCMMATLFLCIVFTLYQPLLTSSMSINSNNTTASSFLTVNCLPTLQDNKEININIQIENISQTTLYILDGSRMPYIMPQEDDSLLILYGVTPIDPTSSYFDVSIPSTKPIQPKQIITKQISLTPLTFGDHYTIPLYQNDLQQLYGPTTVYCQVGWGHSPILPPNEEEVIRTIYQLLEWQQLSTAEPITVDFPFSN